MRLRASIAIVVLISVGCRTHEAAVSATRVVAPAYPPLALTAAIEADVVVLATIDESGNVRAAAVTHGHPLLDRAALTAAQRWSFNVGRGSRQADLTFSFRLNKDSAMPRESSTTFVSPFRVEVIGVLPAPVVNYDHRDSR